jgi:hypothetical protein
MDFRLSKVIGFIAFFAVIFYTFVDLLTGKVTNYALPAVFTQNVFSISNINTIIDSIIGSGNSYGIFYFLHVILAGILFPFAFIYEIFNVIISVIIWLATAMVYPFSFLPLTLSVMLGSLITIIVVVSLISSIKIGSSGVE